MFLSSSVVFCELIWVFYFISSRQHPIFLFTSDFIIITSLFICITVFSICLLSFLLLVPYNPLFPAHELLQGPFPYYNLIPSEIPSACCSRIRKFLLLICLEWADVNDTKVNKTNVNLERTVASWRSLDWEGREV